MLNHALTASPRTICDSHVPSLRPHTNIKMLLLSSKNKNLSQSTSLKLLSSFLLLFKDTFIHVDDQTDQPFLISHSSGHSDLCPHAHCSCSGHAASRSSGSKATAPFSAFLLCDTMGHYILNITCPFPVNHTFFSSDHCGCFSQPLL